MGGSNGRHRGTREGEKAGEMIETSNETKQKRQETS